MNFTEEQLAFRDSVRRMAERHVAPIAAEIDETDRFPTELLPIYGDMGLMQLWVPEKYGGPEGNLTLMCIAREEISRHSPACGSIAGLNTMFIMPLLHFGTEEQRQRILPEIAEESWKEIQASGPVFFAWAGSSRERGQPHYYRVQGKTFLLEYDNTQNDANHVHSVWRDFDSDFGMDLLSQHVKAAH